MFVESTLQHIEYLSVQMPANNSPAAPEDGQNISRSANHIYVNCAKYLSNLYSNCEFHFVVSRVSFVVILYCCCSPFVYMQEEQAEVRLMMMATGTKQHCSFMLI